MQQPNHRYRQVHLDFHTAAECLRVGADFDAGEFADTFARAHVNAVNIFAKCHHGYSYYPTKVGTVHPELKFDLLGAQIEALHRRDIKCPVYISVMWDDLAGVQHPEWVAADKSGRLVMRPPLSGQWGWTTMDVASGYADYFCAQAEEVVKGYEIDGLWCDITFITPNYSAWSQAQMRAAGVDVEDDAAVRAYATERMVEFYARVTKLLHSVRPQATIFYNGSMTPEMMGRSRNLQTHFEVESLPTSGDTWGYLHYPIVARQARTYGKEFIGMTGRFHRSWADFGGLKTKDQLDYECGVILAAGGRVCVGDQLHPRGALDPAVYRLLEHSFRRVEALEPWIEDAAPTAEVAILALGRREAAAPGVGSHTPDVEGAAQLFLETGIQFDIVDPAYVDLARYPALALPDGCLLDAATQAALEAYLAGGGKLILSGAAGLDPASAHFQLGAVPVEYLGPAPTQPSYLRLDKALAGKGELAADYDYVFYGQAHRVRLTAGGAHGELRSALFNRTWRHYTSHQHAPVGEPLGSPLVVQTENVLYFAAPLFTGYRHADYWAYRAIALNALRSFLAPPLLIPTGPGWVEMSLLEQPAAEGRPPRKVVHVVAYHPRRSLQPVPHVDQSWSTAGLGVKVRVDGAAPQRAYLAPEGRALRLSVAGGYAAVDLPPIGPHAVVVFE